MIEEQLEEIHSHFARSHIRLKRQWLREVLGYLHTIQINGYSLINLVYHQWLYTDIGESTELQQRLISSRHGQEQQSLKQLPEASIFQIQSVLDIGTARQKQYKKLTPDYDEFTTEIGVNGFGDFNLQKVSKCFCIQVSDGQGQLKAFEKERVPQLTLSTCPGSKILIYGGTRMERGVLFLKPNNCQLLGGAVKSLMQTKHILKLLAPQAPPPAISRPANAATAPIPAAQPQVRRQPMPDGRALASDRPTNAATPPAPTIPQPKRQLVIPERTSAIINKRPSSNAAATAPVPFARPQPQFVPDGRAAAPTIISRPTNTATPPAVAAAQPPQIGGHRLVSERHVRAYRQLNVTPLASVVKKLQFTVGCKQFSVIAFVQEFTSTFRIVDGKWAMSVALVDDSRQRLECSMAHELLLSLISMTPKEAMEIKSCGSEQRKKEGAKRLELMQEQLRRLDLVFGIEGMPGMKPVVLRVQTLADQLGIV